MSGLARQIETLRAYAKAIGWSAAFWLRFGDLLGRTLPRKRITLSVNPRCSRHRLLLRTGTSDREVFCQVFIEDEYGGIELNRPKMIMDLGANVGYSSAFFLSRYPEAKVLAIEPDPRNYALCCRNLAPFGERAKVVQGAVWPEAAKLALDKGTYRDGRDWATRVKLATQHPGTEEVVAGFDVPALIAMCPIPEIDLLKIDIEGSELELFARNTERWLACVHNICIELHDADCESAFLGALRSCDFDLHTAGDITICQNLRIADTR